MSYIEDVMTAVVKSAQEAVKVTLGFTRCDMVEKPASLLDSCCGAFIPLTAETNVMQIGMLSDEAGGAEVAGRLMGEKPETEAEKADALGEIVNIIAGGTKRRLDELGIKLKLGLPFIFKGEIYFKEPIEIAFRNCTADGTNLLLVVILKKEPKE